MMPRFPEPYPGMLPRQPQQYQGLTEGYLQEAGGAFGGIGGAGAAAAGFGSTLAGTWQQDIRPLFGQLTAMAERSPEMAVSEAAADVGLSYDKAQGMWARQLSGLGVDPSSPQYAAMLNELQQSRAAAEAGAKTKARRAAIEENFQRLLSVAGLGAGLPGAAISGMSAGASGLAAGGAGMLRVAQEYGQLAAESAMQQELQSLFMTKGPRGPILQRPKPNYPATVLAETRPASFSPGGYGYPGTWSPAATGMVLAGTKARSSTGGGGGGRGSVSFSASSSGDTRNPAEKAADWRAQLQREGEERERKMRGY